MCARMNDADQASSTEKWFTEAQKNIRGAKRLSGKRDLDRLTIFHLQQAMEMTVKGLATAHGRTHGQLKEFSHNYIELYVSLLEEILEGSGLITVINGVLSAFYEEGSSCDAIKHLSNTRDHVLSPRSSRKRRTDADWKRISCPPSRSVQKKSEISSRHMTSSKTHQHSREPDEKYFDIK